MFAVSGGNGPTLYCCWQPAQVWCVAAAGGTGRSRNLLCARKASLLHDTRCAWYLRKGRLGTYAYFSYLFNGFYAVVD